MEVVVGLYKQPPRQHRAARGVVVRAVSPARSPPPPSVRHRPSQSARVARAVQRRQRARGHCQGPQVALEGLPLLAPSSAFLVVGVGRVGSWPHCLPGALASREALMGARAKRSAQAPLVWALYSAPRAVARAVV